MKKLTQLFRNMKLSLKLLVSYVLIVAVAISGMAAILYRSAHEQLRNGAEQMLAQAAQSVRLTVADTGIGIAPEHQERIFERFYRVDKSHSKASGGTGLGLSIVKHAVAYHHGKIDLQSTPGKGTTISVAFPAQD